MTSVIRDSIEKITVPIRNYIGYQNDLTCIAKMIGSPKKRSVALMNERVYIS